MNTEERERVVIKPEDLRRGNLVSYGTNEKLFIQVRTIGETGINGNTTFDEDYPESQGFYDEYKYKDLEPIALSPEMLEKVGFRKIYESEFSTKYEHEKYVRFGYRFRRTTGIKQFLSYSNHVISCDFLHQMQNIFYWLNNCEELIINL